MATEDVPSKARELPSESALEHHRPLKATGGGAFRDSLQTGEGTGMPTATGSEGCADSTATGVELSSCSDCRTGCEHPRGMGTPTPISDSEAGETQPALSAAGRDLRACATVWSDPGELDSITVLRLAILRADGGDKLRGGPEGESTFEFALGNGLGT